MRCHAAGNGSLYESVPKFSDAMPLIDIPNDSSAGDDFASPETEPASEPSIVFVETFGFTALLNWLKLAVSICRLSVDAVGVVNAPLMTVCVLFVIVSAPAVNARSSDVYARPPPVVCAPS
jgi:hypothetical protein